MHFYRPLRQAELTRDLLVREAVGELADDVALAMGQRQVGHLVRLQRDFGRRPGGFGVGRMRQDAGQIGLARHHAVDRAQDLVLGRGFQDIAVGAGIDDLQGQGAVLEPRHGREMERGIGLAHRADAVRPGHARHHQIEEGAGHLRAARQQVQRRVKPGNFLDAHARQRVAQQQAKALAEQGVVVGDQNFGGCCHRWARSKPDSTHNYNRMKYVLAGNEFRIEFGEAAESKRESWSWCLSLVPLAGLEPARM